MLFLFLDYSCNPDYQIECADGRCLPEAYKCDGRKDCIDGVDEIGCGESLLFR